MGSVLLFFCCLFIAVVFGLYSFFSTVLPFLFLMCVCTIPVASALIAGGALFSLLFFKKKYWLISSSYTITPENRMQKKLSQQILKTSRFFFSFFKRRLMHNCFLNETSGTEHKNIFSKYLLGFSGRILGLSQYF